MRPLRTLLLPTLLALCASCGELADEPARGAAPRTSEPTLWFEPPAEQGAVAPITHFHVSVDGPVANAGPPVLVAGTVSSSGVRDLARGDISDSFRKRIRDIDWWEAPEGHLVVAAVEPLEEATRYTVILPLISWSQTVSVIPTDPLPRLVRVWPPAAEAPSTRLIVWCLDRSADGEVVSWPSRLALAPALAEGILDFGVFPGVGRGCVRWEARDPALDVDLVPPTTLALADGRVARVQPGRVTKGPGAGGGTSGVCPDGTQDLGPACLEVQDDRIMVHTAGEPLLVSVRADGRAWAAAVTADRWMTVRPFAPESYVAGVVHVARLDGTRSSVGFEVRTQAVLPHLIINEVMSNPLGPEPQQEWVELFNDGPADVSFAGWRLEDTSGSTVLPDFVLAPRRYALVVSESYAADSWVDRPAAPGTPIVRVPALGKSGIANGGEPLRLVTPDGRSASEVPAIACSTPGTSIARVFPDAPASLPESFVLLGDGGTPGSANTLVD